MVLRNIKVNEEQMQAAASRGYLNATELADYLVRKGMPFRNAHETVGRVVLQAIERGIELNEFSVGELHSFSELIEEDVFEALKLENALATKAQRGGTSPETVSAALAQARSMLAQ